VLDEATSALDAASETAVLATIRRRLPQTILIAVSHRPGVAAIADQCLTIGADLVATVTGRPACAAVAGSSSGHLP
jgi:ATP-binding cassette subfamily C protein